MKSSKLAALVPMGFIFFTSAIAPPFQPQAALGATFGQTEVQQDKFIAVAVPRNNNYYNLTILEQVSDQRRCWAESSNRPTIIQPLLLQFNFSGICGRSSDSNGYSIRHNGKDLGLQYRLTLQASNNEVLLIGTPASSSQGEPIVIGRTHGLSSSLMKIDLDPGWKFTKRNYQGKTLGHIYLTKEGSLPMGGTTKLPRPSSGQIQSSPSSGGLQFPTSLGRTESTQIAKASSSNRFYRLYVQTKNSSQEKLVRSLVPGAFRSSYKGQSVMQAGLFEDRAKAQLLENTLNRRGLRTALIEENAPSIAKITLPTSSNAPIPQGPVLRVPTGPAPLGNARGEGDVYGRGNTTTPPPPPNPTLALAKRHRILVPARSSQEESRIRTLVKDAFRSSYQGQSMMQVGSYTDMSEAQPVIQLMQRNGFRTVVD